MRLNNDLPLLDLRGVFGVIDDIGGRPAVSGGGQGRHSAAARAAVGTPAERVREAIAIAKQKSTDARDGELVVGCVVTLAIVADGRLTIGHVGDTRLYKIHPEGIRKVTRDHSPVGEREDAGELSEAEAMRHPRRHEVFRDVGTVYRDKDEQEFVDVIEEPLEADVAILLCSDGLSDMLPAATIAHLVRQHAGAPERVVEALVAAANDAGGRDNVTVVYAEMPLFAERLGRAVAEPLTPTEPTGAARDVPTDSVVTAASPARAGRLARAARAVFASRTTWFAVGAICGVVGALALTAYVATTQLLGPRTLAVALDGTAPFTSITAAIAASRPGDVVRVEPGIYREDVEVRDGADLVARVPGTVTIVHPAASTLPVLSLTGAFNAGSQASASIQRAGRIGVYIATATIWSKSPVGSPRDRSPRRRVSRSTAASCHRRDGAERARRWTSTFMNSVFVRTGQAAIGVRRTVGAGGAPRRVFAGLAPT